MKTSRSFCPSCGSKLGFFELIPVLGWIILKGKCRHCKSKIPLVYPVSEAIIGILFVLLFMFCEGVSDLICGLGILLLLAYGSFYDIETREIPDFVSLSILLLWLMVKVFETGFINIANDLTGGILVPAVLVGIAFVMKKKTGKTAIGGGDIKLLAAVGLHLGAYKSVLNIMLMSMIGLIFAAVSGIKKSEPFAFAPFISISAMAVYLFGDYVTLI